MSRIAYRPEIDGLRALAVVSVVLFHTHLKFSGGYVGVDVFFVISGYLITALISADIAAGTFSLRDFWERRVRRIMPAATVTVLVSLAAGYVLLLPSDFDELGRSAVAQALMVANVFFYSVSGYFETAGDSKPLLHFWSLAVEEQFYLFFPFLLLALRNRIRDRAFKIVAVAAVLSFVVSVAGVTQLPEATFLLLPTRAWELALGSLLALRGCRLPLPERFRTVFGWMGMALMLVPIALYDAQTPFPGLAALPPCLGAMLVIWATAQGDGLLKRLLSLRPVVLIGLLSYSLYLWHWPVMVYSHYWFTGLHSPLVMRASVVIVSFALAWLSWRYVEIPFRARRDAIRGRAVLFGALAASCVTVVVGSVIVRQGGLPGRFPPQVAKIDDAADDRPDREEADLTTEAAEAGDVPRLSSGTNRGPSILLWGDSHARVVSPAVEAMCTELGLEGYRASRSESASLLEWGSPELRRHNAAVLRWIEQRRPTWVVLASRWEKVLKAEEDERSLRDTVEALQAMGVKVAIMRQVASQQRDIPKTLALATLMGDDVEEVGVTVAQHAAITDRSNDIIDRVARDSVRIQVLDPIPYLSRDGRCLAAESGYPLYYDYQHLTRYGASFLTPMFTSMIESGRQSALPRRSEAASTDKAKRPDAKSSGRVADRFGGERTPKTILCLRYMPQRAYRSKHGSRQYL